MPASIAIYARYDTDTYAQILQSVDTLDITSVQYANLPELTEQDCLDRLAATADNHLVPLLSQLEQDAALPSVPARSTAQPPVSQPALRPRPASRQPRAVRSSQLTLDDDPSTDRSSSSSAAGLRHLPHHIISNAPPLVAPLFHVSSTTPHAVVDVGCL